MPKPNSPEPAISEIEQLFLDTIPLIPAVVRQACQSLNHHPNQMEFDGLCQRIVLLLMGNDFHTLRSFSNDSKPQTWLFTIARRLIIRRLKAQKRELPLEDFSPDSFTTQPEQEEKLISEENEKRLLAVVSELTEHERTLFCLILQRKKAKEIAKELGIKKNSVYPEKSALLKKLRQILKAA
ncbi:MAG: sigma-70 family RNA polymerase sigma factor [Acidobacteriota bacterium]|nr:sigma-70 family RNA polymerase sigma factor [Acidobacteriota bacterium]